MPVTPRHAAIYLRISHDPYNTQVGVTRQRDDCQQLASSRYPHLPVTLYTDNDTSAYRGPRPEYSRMLDDNPAVIIAWNLDRLLRQPRELEHLIDRGIPIITATGDLDLTTHDGQLQARILVAVAKKSSDDTSRRTKRAALSRAESGGWHGGPAPFGYHLTPTGLQIHPSAAAVIHQAVEQFLHGGTLPSLVLLGRELGGPTTAPGWRKLLRSPALAGLTRTGHRGDWEPIISQEDHARVVALLDLRKTGKREPTRRHWLVGLMYCGKCDAAGVTGHLVAQGRGRYTCAHCSGITIVVHHIEPFVEGLLFEAVRVKSRDTGGTSTPDPSPPNRELSTDALNTRLAALAEAFVRGDITEMEWKAARQAADQVAASSSSPPTPEPVPPELEVHWSTFSPRRKARIAQQMIERLTVLPGHAPVDHRVLVTWRQ